MSVAPRNPPAFPREDYQTDCAPGQRGMSLRDYFAGQALIACIARLGPMVKVEWTGTLTLMPDHPAVTDEDGRQIRNAIAQVAYDYADAMLKARESK